MRTYTSFPQKFTCLTSHFNWGCILPVQISKIKESNKTKQYSLEGRREKELHVCLVFMCTRVDTCINKHFSFKISRLNPPPLLKFLDPRLVHNYIYIYLYLLK